MPLRTAHSSGGLVTGNAKFMQKLWIVYTRCTEATVRKMSLINILKETLRLLSIQPECIDVNISTP
jgi:hypothetical protein